MYRIGDFSLITRVSIKMLRHYDELGLLQPAYIDPDTRYRYYQLDQIPRLNRIMALKDMGFSLSEIGRMLEQPLSLDQIRHLVRQKEQELAAEAEQLQARIRRLAVWSERIELEEKMPDYEVIIKPYVDPAIPGTPLARDARIPLGDLDAGMSGNAPQPLRVPLPTAERQRQPFPGKASFDHDVLFEPANIPTPEALACVIHRGSVVTLVQAYIALDTWIQANSYRIAGPPREVEFQADSADPDNSITEILLPVARTKDAA